MIAMARSHAARAWIVTGIVGFCAALPLLSSPAEARPAAQPPRQPLAVTVTSMSPSYAQKGQTITITGQIRNLAATAATGLSVQLMWSQIALGTRLGLKEFADGNSLPVQVQVPVAPVNLTRLGAGRAWSFTVHLPVSKLGLSCFGVYPLTVQVSDAALDIARDPVPLPYWPPKATSCTGQRRPQPFPISWVWPLIDKPHQNACSGLTDNELAKRIAPRGRLSYLLSVGARYSAQAGLTWAIDPSLLEGVRAMSQPYQVGASARCRAGASKPADPDASRWLASLRMATTGQPVFLTPYADVDLAALNRQGDISDLHSAFVAAEQAGHQILRRSPVPAPVPADPRQLSAIAWPAAGIASQPLLDTLATQGVSTVILAAPAISPVSYTPGAVSRKQTGIGRPLQVLLADHAITNLLGSKAAASARPGDIFQTSQLYLAQTAMIVSEAPSNTRPIMITPPRRWDPPMKLASGLLSDTVSAPWLKPSTAGQMISQPVRRVYPQVTQGPSAAELPATLLHDVSKLDHRIQLLQSIRVKPDPALNRAVFGIESAAWRGNARHARLLFNRAAGYVRSQLHGVTIRGGGGRHNAYRVTFGGKTSSVNVVIRNDLRYPVVVGLQVEANRAKVTGSPTRIRVPPLSFSSPVKLAVHVKAEHGKIRLSLMAPTGSPLAKRPLPAFPLVILVHPTDFGTVALVICAGILALFVIASAARAIRMGRPAPPPTADDFDAPTHPPTPGDHAEATPGGEAADRGPEPVDAADSMPTADTADGGSQDRPDGGGLRPPDDSHAPSARPVPDIRGRPVSDVQPISDAGPVRDARPAHDGPGSPVSLPVDGAARRPMPSGWVTPPDLPGSASRGSGTGREGFLNLNNSSEYADSVGEERSELTSADPRPAAGPEGLSVTDQDPRRGTEERR
jgi:hypothetical protein